MKQFKYKHAIDNDHIYIYEYITMYLNFCFSEHMCVV